MYLVEYAMHNIKLAFKLQDWLQFKNCEHSAVWKKDTTAYLCKLNEAPFHLSVVLNFWRIPLHSPPAII